MRRNLRQFNTLTQIITVPIGQSCFEVATSVGEGKPTFRVISSVRFSCTRHTIDDMTAVRVVPLSTIIS